MDIMIVTQTIITPQLATAASMLIRMAHPTNQSLHRALAKAEERLISQPWRVDTGMLRIVSYSRQNETHRTDGDFCECETKRGVCWHRSAWLIVSTLAATGCYVVANLPLPSVLDDDDLPGDFLDSLPDEDTYGRTIDGWDDYGDVLPPAPAIPFKLQPARTTIPELGSAFERAQQLADAMMAA